MAVSLFLFNTNWITNAENPTFLFSLFYVTGKQIGFKALCLKNSMIDLEEDTEGKVWGRRNNIEEAISKYLMYEWLNE